MDLKEFKKKLLYTKPYGYDIGLDDKELERFYYLCINLSSHPSEMDKKPEKVNMNNIGSIGSKILKFRDELREKDEP